MRRKSILSSWTTILSKRELIQSIKRPKHTLRGSRREDGQSFISKSGAINNFTLFELCHHNWSTCQHGQRRTFLETLTMDLTSAYIISRLQNNRRLHRSPAQLIEKFVRATSEPPDIHQFRGPDGHGQVKRSCSLCKASGKLQRDCKLTATICQICDQIVNGPGTVSVHPPPPLYFSEAPRSANQENSC